MKNTDTLVEELKETAKEAYAEYLKCKEVEEKSRKKVNKIWNKRFDLKGKENQKERKALYNEIVKINHEEINVTIKKEDNYYHVYKNIKKLLKEVYHTSL
jgi:hypothetical protein